jgi:hypothetical protein
MFKVRSGQLAGQNSIESLAVSSLPAIGNFLADSNAILKRFPSLQRLRNTDLYEHLERRSGARVNLRGLGIRASSRLCVSVECSQRQIVVRPVDLSLKDICVESEQIIARHGDRVEVTLSYGDIAVVLPAIALRRSAFYLQTAFLFIDDGGNVESRSNSDLEMIYQTLVTKGQRLRYRRLACFMLSAACPMLLMSWFLS